MSESQKRKQAGVYPNVKFKPGIVNVDGQAKYIDRNGRAYTVRIGPRISDPIEAEKVRQAARGAEMEITEQEGGTTT